jgi:ATP-dependent RNA helicase DDX24/MAK5
VVELTKNANTIPKPKKDVVKKMDVDKPSEGDTTKAKKAKKKKKKSKPDEDAVANTPSSAAAAANSPQEEQEAAAPEKASLSLSHPVATLEQVRDVQLRWSHASGGAVLHKKLCHSLATMGYFQPTPIQLATLSAAVMGRRNLVGAAPTGSGKTLAFLLPIVQHLMMMEEQGEDDGDNDDKSHDDKDVRVHALIVTPTHELALQIHAECEKLLPLLLQDFKWRSLSHE